MNCQFIDSRIPKFSYYHFTEEGFSCKIVPAFGGSIQELIIDGKHIIGGTTLDETGYEDYLQNCYSAILFPFPNRVKDGTYTFENNTYTLPLNEPNHQNAIHGLVFDKHFETISFSDQSLTLRIRHLKSQGFPFPFDLNVTYTISRKNIRIDFLILNNGSSNFPFGVGWHPYFVAGNKDNPRIHFNSDKKYEVNEFMIPYKSEKVKESSFDLTNIFMDNAYRLSDNIIKFNTNAYQLKMIVPDKNYLQLYTPSNRNLVAIEPMSCISNAFNNEIGVQNLKIGRQYSWEVDLTITC